MALLQLGNKNKYKYAFGLNYHQDGPPDLTCHLASSSQAQYLKPGVVYSGHSEWDWKVNLGVGGKKESLIY